VRGLQRGCAASLASQVTESEDAAYTIRRALTRSLPRCTCTHPPPTTSLCPAPWRPPPLTPFLWFPIPPGPWTSGSKAIRARSRRTYTPTRAAHAYVPWSTRHTAPTRTSHIYMLWHLPHTSPMPTRSLPVADPSSLRDDESSERERRRQGRPMLKACTRHTHGGHTVVEPCAYHVHTPRVRSIEASALLYHVSQGRVEASGHCRAATVTPQASHA